MCTVNPDFIRLIYFLTLCKCTNLTSLYVWCLYIYMVGTLLIYNYLYKLQKKKNSIKCIIFVSISYKCKT